MLATWICVQCLWKVDRRGHWEKASEVQSGTEDDRRGKL